MARISLRSLKAWLPLNLIFPTLTLGPSSILKTRMTALLEAMRSYCGVTLANCRPCSASNSFSTTSALFIVDIAGPAEDSRRQGVAAHAAVADEIDTLDHKLLLRGGLRVPRRMIFDNVFAVCVVKGSREKIGMRRCGGMRAGIFERGRN